jgi:hypothetical protein
MGAMDQPPKVSARLGIHRDPPKIVMFAMGG